LRGLLVISFLNVVAALVACRRQSAPEASDGGTLTAVAGTGGLRSGLAVSACIAVLPRHETGIRHFACRDDQATIRLEGFACAALDGLLADDIKHQNSTQALGSVMSDLAIWLESIGLAKYRESFEREAVDLADLVDLTEGDLERLGLPMGPRKRMLRALAEQRRAGDRPGAPAPESRLAATVSRSRAAIEGERRIVTILFAEVADSTNLVQDLDAEAVSALFDPLQRVLIDAVHTYGGTVNEVLGDGIMAIFGAPLAHEDRALRACQAALDMQSAAQRLAESCPPDSVGRSIRLRVGLNSGEAVVRAINNDLSISYSAMGVTTHLAARMEQTAPPGTIRLTEQTRRLVADFIDAAPSPSIAVKGIAQPVAVFDLAGLLPARSRLEARGARGLTPFVGRESELSHLLTRFEEAATGRGQAVAIVAEPGLGKSRLLFELRRRIGERAGWWLGQCVSHGAALAFHPIVDLLRRHFAIAEADPAQARRTKIRTALAELGGNMDTAQHYLEYLAGGVSDTTALAADPQLRRADTFNTIVQLIGRSAEVCPQVMVIEDLHWSDRASLELLERLVDALPLSRVLLLATLRPDQGAGLPERSYVTRLVLDRMARRETGRLLEAVLGQSGFAEELGELVLAKAEGNPFFVEELVRALVETGRVSRRDEAWQISGDVGAAAVPDTIQQVLMSRIDRLGEDSRRALQVAAVIGREFSATLLAVAADLASVETVLRSLQAAELVHQKAAPPDSVYVFKHALTQEVAYASLLMRTRRELHRRIAAAIEAHHAPRLAEHRATLGHHLSVAEDWPAAADHLEAAAGRAAETAAIGDAVALLDRAADCLQRVGATGERLAALHSRKAALLQIVSQVAEVHAAAARAVALAQEAGAEEIEGTAWAQMGLASFYLHRFPDAKVESRRAIAIGRRIRSAAVMAAGGCSLGWVEAVSGELRPARRTLGRAARQAHEASLPAYAIVALAVQAQIDSWQGDYARALRRLRSETVPLLAAREAGETQALLFPHILTLFSLGLPLAGKGALDDAYGAFAEGLALAEQVGDEIFRMRFLNSLGHVLAECGDLDAARPLNERSRELARDRSDAEVIANAELNLADGFLANGDAALAREICEGVHGVVRSPTTSDFMRWRYTQHLFACMGEAWLALDQAGKAADCADQCLDLATRTSSRKYLARGWRLKAGTALARGDRDAAETMLGKAVATARLAHNPGQIWRSELALGALLQEGARNDAARRRFAAAQRTLTGLQRGIKRPELRGAFLGSSMFHDAFGAAGTVWRNDARVA
jgi:class 3 adenylate cyclase/tetratricopeptide (TPR) repeat protein